MIKKLMLGLIALVAFQSSQKITVMGLRFAGTAFTTIRASVRLP
jgi:hypothetical protein